MLRLLMWPREKGGCLFIRQVCLVCVCDNTMQRKQLVSWFPGEIGSGLVCVGPKTPHQSLAGYRAWEGLSWPGWG